MTRTSNSFQGDARRGTDSVSGGPAHGVISVTFTEEMQVSDLHWEMGSAGPRDVRDLISRLSGIADRQAARLYTPESAEKGKTGDES
ncbi:MAG: hypothetical protein LC650_05060 [Actinobacteria bacterium]|nr:hypothetical protein [Actinomycetota bacterium]